MIGTSLMGSSTFLLCCLRYGTVCYRFPPTRSNYPGEPLQESHAAHSTWSHQPPNHGYSITHKPPGIICGRFHRHDKQQFTVPPPPLFLRNAYWDTFWVTTTGSVSPPRPRLDIWEISGPRGRYMRNQKRYPGLDSLHRKHHPSNNAAEIWKLKLLKDVAKMKQCTLQHFQEVSGKNNNAYFGISGGKGLF